MGMSETLINDKKRNHANQVAGYLKPNLNAFFKRYVEVSELSRSEAINEAVRCLKCHLPVDVQQRMGLSKNSY